MRHHLFSNSILARSLFFLITFSLISCSGGSSSGSQDTTPPVITLTGANPQSIEQGFIYNELGATAQDNNDGNISGNIRIDSNAIDTSTIGN